MDAFTSTTCGFKLSACGDYRGAPLSLTLNARKIPLFKSEELNEILKSELNVGNEIVEESAWPPKCKKLIILKRRFQKTYTVESLRYSKIGDSHYWYAEYSSIDSSECLACR